MLLKFKTKKLFIIAYVMEYPLPSKKKKKKEKDWKYLRKEVFVHAFLSWTRNGSLFYGNSKKNSISM